MAHVSASHDGRPKEILSIADLETGAFRQHAAEIYGDFGLQGCVEDDDIGAVGLVKVWAHEDLFDRHRRARKIIALQGDRISCGPMAKFDVPMKAKVLPQRDSISRLEA